MSNSMIKATAAAAALAAAATIAISPTTAVAAGAKEKCFGIALKGKNDCAQDQAQAVPVLPPPTISAMPGNTPPRALVLKPVVR